MYLYMYIFIQVYMKTFSIACTYTVYILEAQPWVTTDQALAVKEVVLL